MFCITTLCITATIAVAVVLLLIAVKIVLQLPRLAPTTNDLATETSTAASLPTELVKYTIHLLNLLYRVIMLCIILYR